jgi:hypothetical protein
MISWKSGLDIFYSLALFHLYLLHVFLGLHKNLLFFPGIIHIFVYLMGLLYLYIFEKINLLLNVYLWGCQDFHFFF